MSEECAANKEPWPGLEVILRWPAPLPSFEERQRIMRHIALGLPDNSVIRNLRSDGTWIPEGKIVNRL